MELTQRMTMHLNGGNEFSELHYEILADGQPTGITRAVRTNGSPKYIKTADRFHFGDETFDALATRDEGMLDWINARVAVADSED